MSFEFKVPSLGEAEEGEIVKWLVAPGDWVAADQPMLELKTGEETVVVVSSPRAGMVQEIVEEGGSVKEDALLALMESEKAEKPEPEGKVLAAPTTRRVARELGIDLSSVTGSGPAGRVTSDDVRRAAEVSTSSYTVPQQWQSEPPNTEAGRSLSAAHLPHERASVLLPEPAPTGDERVPVRGLRRRIWENMALSAFTAAHFTFVEECDVTDLVEVRTRFNNELKPGEETLTYLPFIMKSVIASLKRYPAFNGYVDDDTMEFIKRVDYHLGVAVPSERGLVVPVVRHADRLSLLDLAVEIRRLTDAVRNNSLLMNDLGGSTFTITTLGGDSGLMATPIINYPEVAIMGVHKIKKRPEVIEEEIEVRDMMNLSLSFDQRLIDAHVGAAFTYSVIDLLQNPDRLMMEMS